MEVSSTPEVNFYPVDITVNTGVASAENPGVNTVNTVPENTNIQNSANGSVVGVGTVQSPNFAAGAAGWRLDSNGNLEANDGNFRGDITGASGTFSGLITALSGIIANWTISADALSTGDFDTLDKMYFGSSGLSLSNTFKVTPAGLLTALSALIGGWTVDATSMYATTTGTIKTGATVGAGSNGVIINKDGIKVYDDVLGVVVNLPSDGSAPTFTSGIINTTKFNVSSTGVIRTSETVGDGTASSAGILINNTGLYACKASQSLAAANVRILTDGSGYFSGTFEIGGAVKTIDAIADLQTALDDTATAGGGTVYLKAGTYTLTTDITIPSGVFLIGVSRDGVIIDCNTSYAVKIAGTNVYSTGTVTINNGATEVVGSSTVWTSAMVGRYVLLDGLWYEITAFTDTTHITIEAYEGDNLAGSAYIISSKNTNAQIARVTIQNATGSALVVQYASEPVINDVNIFDSGTGIDMDYVVFPIMQVSSDYNGIGLDMNFVEGYYINYSEFNFNTSVGVVMTNQTRNATFFNSSVNDNTGNGLTITDATKTAFISIDISGNTGKGLEFVATNSDNQITDCVFDSNGSDGLKLTATSDRMSICQSSFTNNGAYGINIAAATCDNNQIFASAFYNNTSGDLIDSGTNTFFIGTDSILSNASYTVTNLPIPLSTIGFYSASSYE